MPRSVRYQVLLPGRTCWVETCHVEPASCARCLEALAAFLAGEIGYDTRSALDRPTEAYQAELACTPDQARELRRLTVEQCWWAAVFSRAEDICIEQPIVADLDLAEAAVR